jgi:predicted amidohydrolase
MAGWWQGRGMQLALVQAAATLDPSENRDRLASLVPEDADLVVLPEAYARDFGRSGSDLTAIAEPLDGPFVREVERLAAERRTTLVAGLFERTEGLPYSTVVVRGGAHADYRKIHLYDSFGHRESDILTAGPLTPATVDLAGTTVGLMTCYDLRFPELARALVDRGAELVVVPAAWVAGPRKVEHWTTLLRARAIENTVHVVGVGQPGPRYAGHSTVVGPLGDVLVEGGEEDETLSVEIDPTAVSEARRTNPSLANRRL